MHRLLMLGALALSLVGCRFVATPSSCTDGTRNGAESDVDCGGPSCTPCALQQACVTSSDCSSGLCAQKVCAPGSCADGVANGDETDVDCGGSCGDCAPGQRCGGDSDCDDVRCSDGMCAAPRCDDAQENGTETDVDCGGSLCPPCPLNGSCIRNTDCASGPCLDGTCVMGNVSGCDAPLLQCGPSCLDPRNNPQHCGGCNQPCGMNQWCVNGACAAACPTGTTACADRCVNTQVDVINCGGCNQPCAPGNRCSGGQCQPICAPNQTSCNGECVSTASDVLHCGQCNQPCFPGEVCAAGQCGVSCEPQLTVCDGGAFCVDVNNDPENCGACGASCPPAQNAVRVCEFAMCSHGACFPNFADCNGVRGDGCETNLLTDSLHCGRCDNPCIGACMNGFCP